MLHSNNSISNAPTRLNWGIFVVWYSELLTNTLEWSASSHGTYSVVRKLVQAALILSLILSLFSMAMMVIGRSDPAQPDLFKYLSTCDGQPCYLGIVPGKTSWDDAVATFEHTQGIEFDPKNNMASNPSGFTGVAVLFSPEQNKTVLDTIDLGMRSSSVNIGSLIEQFGTPCAAVVDLNTETTQMVITFPGMSVLVVSTDLDADQYLRPTTPVNAIGLSQSVKCNPLPYNLAFHPWRGFTRYTN